MRRRLHRRARLVGRAAVLVVMLSAIVPAPAHADVWCWLFGSGCGGGSTAGAGQASERAAPEVDPNALANALALLAGGAAIFTDRLRRR